MGEAISFLFQSVLAFVLPIWMVGSYFNFSAANLGIIGGLSALRQHYMDYEAFGRPSTITTLGTLVIEIRARTGMESSTVYMLYNHLRTHLHIFSSLVFLATMRFCHEFLSSKGISAKLRRDHYISQAKQKRRAFGSFEPL